ncbi:tail fiber protein [Vibrio phage 1.111.B._10N.286.45.E6]|nr:tail fiber protein [Vibrio phage 1.111.A._10N.286.45.E6]AUR88280.1 tail fiber protein [Vibrio phage 1.111.B._10N.286.45.E6]
MSSINYRTKVTELGLNKIRNAALLGSTLNIKNVKIGDSTGYEYEPTGLEVDLKNTVYESAPNSVTEIKNINSIVNVELIVPSESGPFWVREVGVFDSEGDLIFIAAIPPRFKTNQPNVNIDMTVNVMIDVQDSEVVNFIVDPNKTIASHKHVESEIRKRTGCYKVGNISDYVGQSLPEADKLNAYQYPGGSGDWYMPEQGQSFPITIPADPSSDNGWALVGALMKGSAGVGLVTSTGSTTPRTLADRFAEVVNAKDYFLATDPAGDQSAMLQRAANSAITQGKPLYIPSGEYHQYTAINPNDAKSYNSLEIYGDGSGNPYGEDIYTGGTRIITHDCDFVLIDLVFPNDSINLHDFSVYGGGENKTNKLGFVLNLQGDRKASSLFIDNVNFGHNGGLFNYESNSIANSPYTWISRCYSWQTRKLVNLGANVGATIFNIARCLFHRTIESAITPAIGMELSVSDSWFEGVAPHVFEKTSNNFFLLNLDNVFFENKDAATDDSISVFNVGANTEINISGKTNLPGAFYTNKASVLGSGVTVSNFTNKTVRFGLENAIVMTPQTISPDDQLEVNVFHTPLNKASYSDTGDSLINKTPFGGAAPLYVKDSVDMPAGLKRIYGPCGDSDRPVFGDTDTPVSGDGFVSASFIYESSGSVQGFQQAYITIDGVNRPAPLGFLFPTDSDTVPYVCSVSTSVTAANAIDGVRLWLYDKERYLAGGTFKFSEEVVCSSMMPFKSRQRTVKTNIPSGASEDVILSVAGIDLPFYYKSTSKINDGAGGIVQYDVAGTSRLADIIEVLDNQKVSSDFTSSAGQQGNIGVVKISLTNNSGSAATVETNWEF